jgi:hypothetical protein
MDRLDDVPTFLLKPVQPAPVRYVEVRRVVDIFLRNHCVAEEASDSAPDRPDFPKGSYLQDVSLCDDRSFDCASGGVTFASGGMQMPAAVEPSRIGVHRSSDDQVHEQSVESRFCGGC